MATEINIQNVGYRYSQSGDSVLSDISLMIGAGEFVTLLGPSGSGKTTLLKLIAGLIEPQQGVIQLGGRDVTHLPMHRRNIGFVFQHYALFPHLSAAANVAFPLKVRRVPAVQIRQRVDAVLELVGLSEFAKARPRELSGGQQQRVAVARALVFNPDVLLMDEPLGALDRKLRDMLCRELRRLQREIGVTTVYVTHDQHEALVLSNRIAVMEAGRIRQVDVPENVYRQPSEQFVAEFMGDINMLECAIVHLDGNTIRLCTPDGLALHAARQNGAVPDGNVVQCALRPEHLTVSAEQRHADICWQGRLHTLVFQGSRSQATVEVGAGRMITAETRGSDNALREGATVWLTASAKDVMLLE